MVTERKTFTLDEARRALPLVKKIAADLQQAVNALTKLPGGTSFLYGASSLDELAPVNRPKAQEFREQIEALSAELLEIGVEIKGFQPVLVDFPAWRDEEMVCLCWAEGEADIAHWHALSEGYRGRHPL
jgi:hypothetical protein